MLVTGSMAMLVLGVPWQNCAGQLGFFLEGDENCQGRWVAVVVRGFWLLLSTEALFFYYKEKIATATWRKGETEGD